MRMRESDVAQDSDEGIWTVGADGLCNAGFSASTENATQ